MDNITSNNTPTAADRAAAVIQYELTHSVDISPPAGDEYGWSRWCDALKVLGYNCNTFVALSNCPQRDAVAKWQAQKTPAKYVHGEDAAAACILYHADRAGVRANTLCSPSQPWRVQRPKPMPMPTPPQEVVVVPLEDVAAMTAKVMQTNLARYLCRLFRADRVAEILAAYLVGATEPPHYYAAPEIGLWTTYPLINNLGQCVDCKMMGYKSDGHRQKRPDGNGVIDWWLRNTTQAKNATRAQWCCFGDHLANQFDAADPVNVVESEKTALMASLYFGAYWVAVGGLGFLTADRLAAHRHRQIIIYPDADGVTAWKGKMAALREDGYKVKMERNGVKRDGTVAAAGLLPPKADLGDVIEYVITQTDAVGRIGQPDQPDQSDQSDQTNPQADETK